jgi:hypothetical protein
LHPEEVPKTLARFESWLKAKLDHLQEVRDFSPNVEEAVDEHGERSSAPSSRDGNRSRGLGQERL